MTQREIDEYQERNARGETTEREDVRFYMEVLGLSRIEAGELVAIERGGSDLRPIEAPG